MKSYGFLRVKKCLISAVLLLSISDRVFSESLPWVNSGKHGDELEIVKPYLPNNPIILEAGAHLGEDTVILASKWPQSTVLGFEANPYSYKILEQAVAKYSNIRIFPYALFSTTGYCSFNINVPEQGCSSLLDDNHVPGVTWYKDQKITVWCYNLDEWAEQEKIEKIDYMWLDLEGAEYYVLSTAPNIIKRMSAISTEVNFVEFRKGMSKFSDILALMNDYGFTLVKIWGVKDWQGTAVFVRNDLLNAQKD